MRVPREYRTSSKQNYNRFKSENPDIKISYKDYVKVLSTCNKMFITKALETGDPIKLPYGFGKIAPTKYKRKTFKEIDGKKIVNLSVDWKKSREEGFKVYNMNFHSDGYAFKWKWFINTARIYLHDVWVMKPTRWMSRELAKYIFSDKYYSQLYKNY